jgi:hypothetical protein
MLILRPAPSDCFGACRDGGKVTEPELVEGIRLTVIENLLQYHPVWPRATTFRLAHSKQDAGQSMGRHSGPSPARWGSNLLG